MVERETFIESGAALVTAFLFIALVVGVGASFGGQELSASGAWWLVGSVALFVVGMGAMGWWLSARYES
jgi:Kef-type K+ transport system membrane component KefB